LVPDVDGALTIFQLAMKRLRGYLKNRGHLIVPVAPLSSDHGAQSLDDAFDE
jgi:hypothetical protein